MKDIKFRGKTWQFGGSTWVYGDLIRCNGTVYIGYQGERSGEFMEVKVLPDTVGQYTGLKDKDGKEIYEGDIVRGHLETVTWEVVEDVYHGAGLTLKMIGGRLYPPLNADTAKNLKVIGNIYDNPELMEEQQ